ncbi:MAG: bifunctional aldolase/short-chain dehydrogenase [Caldilineaceae bacterium]
MKNLWNDAEASQFDGDLPLRVYTSRLLGRNPDLVLHGGGNTSVKCCEQNLFGEEDEILYVKGSGWNLETIEAPGFSPVRMNHLLKLSKLERLSDTQMARELRIGLTNPSAPDPSVEAILHAILPHKFVDHTHADAVVTLTNSVNGEARIRELYGDRVVVIPYVMPGFKLARLCAQLFPQQAGPQTIGMVLLKHGIFSFGATAKQSYDRMIELVSQAEAYLQEKHAWQIAVPDLSAPTFMRGEVASLRKQLSQVAKAPLILSSQQDAETLNFVQRADLVKISQQGPATPDHVIRTKRLPLAGRDVTAYQQSYEAYFAQFAPHNEQSLTMLDPAPRVLLDPQLGMISIGRSASDAGIVRDIYQHTMQIIQRAEMLGGYEALSAGDLFEMEYWELEQAKLKRGGASKPFAGEVALVTGSYSGIGKACAESLLARGAAVVGFDLNPGIRDSFKRSDYLGVEGDVSNPDHLSRALDQAVQHFGGLDLLVLNAGIFPNSKRIDSLPDAEWEKVLRINLDANLALMRDAHPLLKLAPRGGRVVVIASKNVPAPGPGAAAYSASKAALTQLARVAAMEWGNDRIRINVLHPNAVFDTALWTEDLLKARAAGYKMSVEEYKTNNILHVEVTSRDVGELAAELCGPLFAKTTGAQIPIDGGNDRVI